MAEEQNFAAIVQIAGINPYLDVPARVVEALGGGSKVAVLVKVAAPGASKEESAEAPGRLARDAERLKAIGRLAPGGWFRTTVLVLRSSPPRLYLDTWMREAAGVDVGDRVRVTLKPDRNSRELPMPAMLGEALAENEQARAACEQLAPSRRREILSYLNFLKTPDALERNVQKTIAELVAKEDSGAE